MRERDAKSSGAGFGNVVGCLWSGERRAAPNPDSRQRVNWERKNEKKVSNGRAELTRSCEKVSSAIVVS